MAQHLRIGSVVTNPQAEGQSNTTAVVSNITDAYIELEDAPNGTPRVIVYPWGSDSFHLLTVVTD